MADFDYVIRSGYQPFSMQEMLTPFVMYKEAYDKAEAKYEELAGKANKFKLLADSLDPKSRAYKIYHGYADELEAQSKDFSQNGLNMFNGAALSDLRRRYSGEIGLLEEAKTLWDTQKKTQEAMRIADPSMLFDKDAFSLDLDAYLDNPNISFKSYSGKTIKDQVSNIMTALARGRVNVEPGSAIDQIQKTFYEKHGYSPEDIQAAIYNPDSPGASKILNAVVDSVIQTTGVLDWGNPNAVEQAYRWGRNGLWSGVGEVKVHDYQDYTAKLAADREAHRNQLADTLEFQRLAAAQQGDNLIDELDTHPENFYTPNEINADPKLRKARDYETNIKNFGKYFTTDSDGRIKITNEGVEEYYKTHDAYSTGPIMGTAGINTFGPPSASYVKTGSSPSPFRVFVDNVLGGSNLFKDGKVVGPGRLGNLFAKYVQNKPEMPYDAKKRTRFVYYYSSPEREALADELSRVTNGKLKRVEFGNENNYKLTGDTLDISELYETGDKSKYNIVGSTISPYGNTLLILDKNKGKTYEYEFPTGIHQTHEMARDADLREALTIQKILIEAANNNGAVMQSGANGPIQLTDTDIQELVDKYNMLTKRAYLRHSQIGGPVNTTKKQEFNTYGE